MRQRYVVEVVSESSITAHQATAPDPVVSASGRQVSTAPTQQPRRGARVVISTEPDEVFSAGPAVVQHISMPEPQVAPQRTASVAVPEPTPEPQIVSRRVFGNIPAQQSTPSNLPDFMDDADHVARVNDLWRDSQLADAREPLSVQKPTLTKRVKQQQRQQTQRELSQREKAFQKWAAQPESTTNIETYYRQHRKPTASASSKGKARSSRWSLPGFGKKMSPWVNRHTKLVTSVTVSVLLVLSIFGGGYWWVRSDVLATKNTAQEFWQDIHEGNMQDARERLDILQTKRTLYASWYQTLRPVIRVTQGQTKTNHLDRLMRLSETGLQVADTGLSTYSDLETGYMQFMGKTSGESVVTLQGVSGRLEAMYTELSSLQAELVQLDNPYQIELLNLAQREIPRQLPVLRHTVMAGQQLSQSLPELLGQDGKRQYLLLLQNNAELRATGGFIGSFAVITINEGKFVDLRVQDVYEADGQLNGFVAPPSEIVEHLGEEQWFLRDVNWSPDFPTVATQAEWFLDKSMNIDPDGVIAINLHVAQKLLEASGPVKLVDYDEVVTATNLYERAEMYSEINFFPGSSQKRDFLSAVINQVLNQMIDGKVDMVKTLQALYSSAQESQLLVALDDPAAQLAFENLGWSGSVLSPDCPSPFHSGNCYVDTVMQVESNVGVNKANQHLKRTIRHSVELSADAAVHSRTTTLQNTATSNAWPNGPYKSYFRLYIPSNAQVSSVQVNGAEIDASLRREGEEHGKRMLGFLVNVPVRETATVQVQYSVPLDATMTAYALFEQKQSGTAADDVQHRVTVNGRGVKTVAPEPLSIQGRSLEFVSTRQFHDFMAVEFE